MPWLDETRRASARARGGGGCNGSVGVWWQWTRAKTSTGRVKGATLRKHAYSLANHHAATWVRHIFWIFRLLRGGWLGCTRAFVKWHLSPYPLKFSLWSTATTHPHCHCTPRHPRARALARLVSSSQGMAGLAWHGMVWLGVRARCFHNEVW